MDRQGPPNWPHYQLTRGLTRTRHEKDAMTSRCLDRKRKYDVPPGECTLLTGPAGYYIQDVFFWRLAGPVAPTGKAVVHWIGY